MPYFAMFDRLRAFLRSPSATLVISGYSFHDSHINREIIQGLQSNPSAVAFALIYGKLSDYIEATNLAALRANLTIFADDGAIIGTQDLQWSKTEINPGGRSFDNWVNWMAIKCAGQPDCYNAIFKLGDYSVLGQFLQSLIGRANNAIEAKNA